MTGPRTAAAFPEIGFDDLCILAVTARPGELARATTRAPGLPDEAYENDGQITRRELRAVALAALRPGTNTRAGPLM